MATAEPEKKVAATTTAKAAIASPSILDIIQILSSSFNLVRCHYSIEIASSLRKIAIFLCKIVLYKSSSPHVLANS